MTSWRPNWKANTGCGLSQLNEKGKVEYPRKKKDILVVVKSNNVTLTFHNRECF